MKLKKSEKKKVSVNAEAEPKEEKLQKIKTDKFMKVGRIILWVVILFLLLRGIGSIMAPRSETVMEKMITDYQAEADLRERIQIGAAAFAEDFSREYYTFSGKYNSDYEKRLRRYLAKSTDVKNPLDRQYSTIVTASTAQNIIYHSNKDYDVDIHLQVEYTPLEEGLEALKKDIYLRVPISSDGRGGYAVTSLPIYTPETAAMNIAGVEAYTGLQVESNEIPKIKETLNSFLTVYFSGTANELSYYLTPDSSIKEVAAGMVKFEKLEYATVSQDGATKDYLVEAKFTVSDEGRMLQQKVFLRMKYAKKHYYIKDLNTRPI